MIDIQAIRLNETRVGVRSGRGDWRVGVVVGVTGKRLHVDWGDKSAPSRIHHSACTDYAEIARADETVARQDARLMSEAIEQRRSLEADAARYREIASRVSQDDIEFLLRYFQPRG